MNNLQKSRISIFFLATFLLLRVINIHEISHSGLNDDHSNHCEQCIFFGQENKTNPLFIGTEVADFSFQPLVDYNVGVAVIKTYRSPQIKVLQTDFFFNKPPPHI